MGATSRPISLVQIYNILPLPHPPETAQSATNSWIISSRQAERLPLPPQEVLVEAHERGWLSPSLS